MEDSAVQWDFGVVPGNRIQHGTGERWLGTNRSSQGTLLHQETRASVRGNRAWAGAGLGGRCLLIQRVELAAYC